MVVYEYCDHCFTDCPVVKALKKSYWINDGVNPLAVCSNCGFEQELKTLYCPECGREMSNGESYKKF